MKRNTFIFVLVMLAISTAIGDELHGYVELINEGKLSEAKQRINTFLQREDIKELDRAIAYKNLGTVCFRLGEDYLNQFDASEKKFTSLLKSDIKQVREEYAIMHYQRANCLLSACESELSKSKLQGISVIPFHYIKNYISIANKDITIARNGCPEAQKGDLDLLSMELALTEFHIWTIANQNELASRACIKAINIAEETIKLTDIPADTKKKLLLRYATVLVETDTNEQNEATEKAIQLLSKAMKISSGNAELDSAVVALWAKLLLNSKSEQDDGNSIESELIKSTDLLEQLRNNNVVDMDFTARKKYFATRTGLYEVLVELYAKRNKPFKMLKAIDRMRSRSIQDAVNSSENEDVITNEAQLCQTLIDGNGIMVAFFISTDTVWIVTYDGTGGKISSTKTSGQNIVRIISQVISVFSNVQHPQAYIRYGPSYRPVLEAYKAANFLYNELLLEAHNKFLAGKYDHFYILPHNILNYLPFVALVTQVNENNVFLSRFVADVGLPVTYLPSLSAIVPSMGKQNKFNSMVIARGTYSYPAFYNNCPEDPDNPEAQPLNLPNVLKEGQQVARLLETPSGNCYVEHDASEYNLVKRASEEPISIVHIASHAHLNRTSPMDSYVVLAASHDEDGRVQVSELLNRYKRKLKIGLLVLSACDTNRGESFVQPGDDIAALSNGFLVAGADNVIATQWPASDTSFPQIMEMLYSFLERGATADIALALAQREFLAKGQMGMRYPIFWANIVLNGKNQKNRCL